MLSNLLKIESYKRGIVFSLGFNVISKALVFITNLAIAFYFGTGTATDVYFYGLATVTLMAGFITTLDSSVVIPESMRRSAQHGKENSMLFLNSFLYIYLAIGILITVILWINSVGVFSSISRFDGKILQAHSPIVALTVPLFLLILLTTYLTDVLTSYRFFTVPMIVSIVNSLISLVFLVGFHKTLGIRSLLIGLLVAYFFHLCFLTYLLLVSLRWRFSLRLVYPGHKNMKNIFFALAGNLTSTGSAYVPLFLLSGFGHGVITALNYGQRVADLPTLLIVTQFSSVAAIKFNELCGRNDWEKINEIFLSSLKLLSFILLPISFLTYLYSHEVITILFKHGAFDETAVKTAATFLKYLVLIVPLLAINTLVARLFMAAQKIAQAFWYQTTMNVFLIVGTFLFVSRLGPVGYPYALIIIHLLNVVCIGFFFHYLLPRIHFKEMLFYFTKMLLLNLFLLVFSFGLKILIGNYNSKFSLVCGAWVYLAILLLLNRRGIRLWNIESTS